MLALSKNEAGQECVSFLNSGVMKTWAWEDIAEIVIRPSTTTEADA
jgi:hypothetical protein